MTDHDPSRTTAAAASGSTVATAELAPPLRTASTLAERQDATRVAPLRLSTGESGCSSSSRDSQHDIATAVNTPGWATPASPASRHGSSSDLRAPLRGASHEPLSEKQLGKRVEADGDAVPPGAADVSDEEKRRIRAMMEDEAGGALALGRMTSTQATTLEEKMKMRTRRRGSQAHAGPDGVVERREMVDLGNGPESVVIVEWLPDDPENPFNWSQPRKYATVIVAVFITALTAGNATSTGPMVPYGEAWFGVSREAFELTLTLYMCAVAVTPLVLAPLSEVFGRNMIYQVTSVLNALLFLPQILSHNFSGMLAARWFQGMVSSVGNSMVGGTVADVFRAQDRGAAMAVFSLCIFMGQGVIGMAEAWVVQYWGIQWAYGTQAIAAGVSIALNAIVLRETRSDVLLARRAKRLTKQTGINHMGAAELQKQSFLSLLSISAVRPLKYLVTEPIVTALSAWIGFAWAIVLLGSTATLLVFESYGFDTARGGTFEVTVAIGGVLGFISNFHQEHLYHRAMARSKTGRAAPEVRLYWAATGGLLFPLGMYVFAWTGRPEVHWAVPAVALSFAYAGVFTMYSGVFNYLADAYETYSSSAQAAQSFVRNVMSGVFPLFGHQLYVNLGYPYASTLVASIALALALAPVLLVMFGKRLRARSAVASALANEH